jgi:hypothetical protein
MVVLGYFLHLLDRMSHTLVVAAAVRTILVMIAVVVKVVVALVEVLPLLAKMAHQIQAVAVEQQVVVTHQTIKEINLVLADQVLPSSKSLLHKTKSPSSLTQPHGMCQRV